MAIEIPGDWPGRTWVEDTPLGHLETLATDAASGTVPDRWEIASWETTREISSRALPGQVRAKTGLSVGTAKCVVKREGDDYPWKQRAVYALTGKNAQILIAPEGRTEIPTGQFRVAPIEGNLTTLGVAVDLDEQQIEGTEQAPGVLGEQWVSREQFEDSADDPIWLIAELADQMGYGIGTRPGRDGYAPILDVPFQGSVAPAHPLNINYQSTFDQTWTELGDVVAATHDADSTVIEVVYEIDRDIPEDLTITLDTLGETNVRFRNSSAPASQWFDVSIVVPTENQFQVIVGSRGLAGTNANTTTAVQPLAADPDRPFAGQVQLTWAPTSLLFRWRRKVTDPWSAWTPHTMTNSPGDLSTVFEVVVRTSRYTTSTDDKVARLSVMETSANDSDLVLATTTGPNGKRIYLEPLFGSVISPWLDPDLSVWSTMQAIVEAWQGALITDVYGNLHVLNRFSLTGVGTGQEVAIDVGLRFEDVPWVLDYADQADRLVVKYRPVVTKAIDPTDPPPLPTVYEFQDVLIVQPGQNDFFFNLDYIYPVDMKILPFVRKDNDNGVFHVWDAYRYNNGTGNHIDPNSEIQMRIDRVTSSTWKVHIVNLTASVFYMVDNTGTPWLKLRSSYWLDQTQEATIERGLPANEATNALEIDLSNYVQTEADANTLADFIWGRVNQRAWRAKTVVSVPDYRLDLGDVVELVHERTGIRSNALVTKVELAGEPGSVTQKLDLVLIPPTWEDFDEAWANYQPNPPGSWTEFDALWDSYTWADFDRAPTATTDQEVTEAM